MTTTIERPAAPAPPPEPEPAAPARGRRGPAGWAVRWRVALRIATRSARRNRLSTVIATTMIALPVAAAVFLLSVMASASGTAITTFEASYGADTQAYLQVPPACEGCTIEQSPDGAGWGGDRATGTGTAATDAEVRALLPAVAPADIVPQHSGTLVLERDEGVRRPFGVVSLPADRVGEIFAARTGRLPENDREVALSWRDAEWLGVEIGEQVRIGTVDATLTGIIDSRNRPVAGVLTVGDALDLPESAWYVLGDTPVTWAEVEGLNAIGVFAISRYVIDNPPPDEESWTGSALDAQGVGIGAAVAAIAVIEAVLLVGPAFAVGTRRQTRQLALVAASGGSRRDNRRIVLATGLAIGLAAGVVGVVVGLAALTAVWLVLAQGWDPLPRFAVPWWAVLPPVAFAAGLALLASLVPARSVSRLDVVAALAGRRAEATPRGRVPWIGVAFAVVGLGVAVTGGVTSSMLLVVVGIVVLELGMVLSTGGILSLVGRLAPRLGVAGRFAVRDGLRQRSRTVPAVASVMAAVAAVVAGSVYVATAEAEQRAVWRPGVGVGLISLQGDYLLRSDEVADAVPEAIASIEENVALEGWAYTYDIRTRETLESMPTASVELLINPDRDCPATEDTTQAEWEELQRDDPRCGGRSYSQSFWSPYGDGFLVDDGSVVSLLLADGAADAARALAAGSIVVENEDDVWDDGTAHLQISFVDETDPEVPGRVETIVAPAVVSGLSVSRAIVPPSLVEGVEGAETVLIGAVARPAVPYEAEWADRITGQHGGIDVDVMRPFQSSMDVLIAAIVGVATVIALAATWLSVALAGAETRPDLATLSAVGAGPGVTRRVAGAQAAVVAVVGVGVGIVLGLALGWVLGDWTLRTNEALAELAREGGQVPSVTVPWLWLVVIAVVLPALAVAGAWLTAPRRLPLVRRLAQ